MSGVFGLFRQDVVEAWRGEWLGSTIIATLLSRWLLTILAVVLAAAILLFLVFGHHTRREIVTGELVSSAGPLNVVAPSAGTVAKLHVRDGQRVKVGDVLVELPKAPDSATLGDIYALMGQQLDAQRARLLVGAKITGALSGPYDRDVRRLRLRPVPGERARHRLNA